MIVNIEVTMSAYYDEDGTLTVTRRKEVSMMYERNYSVKPVSADPFVPFMMAKEGVGYEEVATGDIRVRTGDHYIRFSKGGNVFACMGINWPGDTRQSWEVEVDISLKVWRQE